MNENLTPIPISKLKETEYSENMWIMVSKEEHGKWKSYRVPLWEIACKCEKTEPIIEPDNYEDLPKNERTVYHVADVVGFDGRNQLSHGLNPMDYDNFDTGLLDANGEANGNYKYLHPTRPGCLGTYKVLDCDEISVFSQSLRIHTGQNPSVGGGYMGGLDVRQSDLNSSAMFGKDLIKVPDYDKIGGGYYAWGNAETRGLTIQNWKLYEDNTRQKDITNGWDIISTAEWLQLICQAPRYKENQWDNIKDFFFGFSSNPVNGWDNHWLKYKNISGLSFFPAGLCQNLTTGFERPLTLHYFGTCAVFTTKNQKFVDQPHLTGFFENTPTYGDGMRIAYWLAWGANIRYSRIKTDEELGYKLIADRLKDKVLFVNPDYDVNSANTNSEPITFEPVEVIPYGETCTYKWNHANSLIYQNQDKIRGVKIVKVRLNIAVAGKYSLCVSSNNQNDPLYIVRSYQFDVVEGYNELTTDITLAHNEWLVLGAFNLEGVETDTARIHVQYPTTVNAVGGRVFTRNNGQTVDNVNPNVGITIQPNSIPRYIELKTGGERGTALRYANRKERVVVKPYSEIAEETKQILSTIKIG